MLSPISPSGVSTAFIYPTQTSRGAGFSAAFSAMPGNTNPPVIFEPPAGLSGGELQVWIIASGASANWGGCEVFASVDDNTYTAIGTILAGQIQGVLSAAFPSGSDPDTTHTLDVALIEPAAPLIGGTMQDADDFLTLCYCDGELIAYSTTDMTSFQQYSLSNYIRRGCFGTTIGAHAGGTQFGRILGSTFTQTYPSTWVGKTIYFQFPAANLFGGQAQALADVPVYSYTLTGVGVKNAYSWFQSFSIGGKFADLVLDEFDSNYEIFDVQMPAAISFPANFSTSPTPGCEVAPGANVTLTFETIHAGSATTLGTLTIAGSATSGTYSTNAVTIPAGDRLRLYAPSSVDASIVGLFGTIAGTR